ncbi:MAG: hypothetical protein WB392_13195 [Methanotrichaceae archaeon]
MKSYKLFQVLLALIFLACLSGVQGQYNASTVGYSGQYNTQTIGYSTAAPNTAPAAAQYAQFYTTNAGSAPSNPISAPQQYNISGNMPATVYFSNQMQSVPFSQYQSNPTYGGSNSLWIKGSTAWSQYAIVPVGANVQLLAISPSSGGSGLFNIVDSNGQTNSYNYFFYPNSQLTFYAGTPGQHTLTFNIGGVTSNPIVIDVAGTVSMTYNPTGPTSNYYPPTGNYNPLIGNYPGYYAPYYDPQSALDLADLNKAYQRLYSDYYNGIWHYGLYP